MSAGSNIFNTGAPIPPPPGALLMPDYDVAIGDDPGTVEWWHPDPGYVTVSDGLVSSLRTQKAHGGTHLSAEGGHRPALLENAINGRAALRFQRNPDEPPDRFVYEFPAGPSRSWTKIMVLRDYGPLQGDVWSADGPSSHRLQFTHLANDGHRVLHRVIASQTSSAIFRPRPVNAWFLIMASFDHVTGRVGLSIDGGRWIIGRKGASLEPATSTIGARPADTDRNSGGQFDAAMIALDNAALHLPEHAAKLALWNQLVRDDFALMIA